MSLLGKGKFSANGDSAIVVMKSNEVQDAKVGLSGTFGGGTVTMHISDDGIVFSPVVDSARTVPDTYNAAITDDCQVKLVLTGATAPDLSWSISRRQPAQ